MNVAMLGATRMAAETIQVVIDGKPYTMKLVSGDASDGVYEYNTKLDEGDHSYYFTASDGTDAAEPGDTTPTTSSTAKTTPKIDKKTVADDTMMNLAIIIVIIDYHNINYCVGCFICYNHPSCTMLCLIECGY